MMDGTLAQILRALLEAEQKCIRLEQEIAELRRQPQESKGKVKDGRRAVHR